MKDLENSGADRNLHHTLTSEEEFERTIKTLFPKRIDVQFIMIAHSTYRLNKLREQLDSMKKNIRW